MIVIYRVFLLTFLNAELNPICHLLALLGAHHILHISRVKVNNKSDWHSQYPWQTGYGHVFLGYFTPVCYMWMNGMKDYCCDVVSYDTLYCSELLQHFMERYTAATDIEASLTI